MQTKYNKIIMALIFIIFILSNMLFIKNYNRIAVNDLTYYYANQSIDFYNQLQYKTECNLSNLTISDIMYGYFFYMFGKSSLSIIILSITLAIFSIFALYKFTYLVTKNQNIAIFALIILLADPVVISSVRRCWPQLYAAFFLYLAFIEIYFKKQGSPIKTTLFFIIAALLHYSSIVYIGICLITTKNKKIQFASMLVIALGIIYLFFNKTYFSQAIETNTHHLLTGLLKDKAYALYAQITLNKIMASWLHHIIFLIYVIVRLFTIKNIKTKISDNISYVFIILISVILLLLGIGIDSLIFPYSLIIIDLSSVLYKALPKSMLIALILLITLNFFPKFIFRDTQTIMNVNRINNIINIDNASNITELKNFLQKHHTKTIGIPDSPFYDFNPYHLKSLDISLISNKPLKIKILYTSIPESEIGDIDMVLVQKEIFKETADTSKTFNLIKNNFIEREKIKISSNQAIYIYRAKTAHLSNKV